jgi:hypothetical protein
MSVSPEGGPPFNTFNTSPELLSDQASHAGSTLAEQAADLQERYDVIALTLRRLIRTQWYAYAMTSVDSAFLPPRLQAIRDIADELEFMCRDFKPQIKQLFEA